MNAPALSVDAKFPPKLAFLFQPKRYKVAYGGRGGAKSWGFGRALILIMLQKKIQVLCARELQNSISESVHRLLVTQIEKMGLSPYFDILNTEIRCKLTGGEFQFAGIRNNTDKIKSYEDYDICWVEEANKVTKTSWNILIPTIRKPGSEIWVSFNPELETDYTYKYFVKNTPPNAEVVHMTYRDNPWFSGELEAELQHMKSSDFETYLWVWEGQTRRQIEGAVYGKQLSAIELAGQLTEVHYSRLAPVDVIFDLGRADSTSLWFRQRVGLQWRFINFYEASNEDLEHYFKVLQDLPYIYGTLFLPHDAKAKRLGTKLSIQEQFKQKSYRVSITPNLSIADGIAAARAFLPDCWFDLKNCDEGLQHLRHYMFEIDQETKQYSDKPKHDEHSHAADAFRYSALTARLGKTFGTSDSGEEIPHPVSRTIARKMRSVFTGLGSRSQQGWMK